MPQVEVSLYATLRRYIDGAASIGVDVEPGCTIEHVLGQLGIPSDQTRIIFLNNRAARLSDTLQGGEQLGIFPSIGGG